MTAFMLNAALGLLLFGALELGVCGWLIGPPWKRRDRATAWLLSSLGSAMLALVLLLVASMLHLRLPLLPLGLLVLAGFDVAVGWVLVMLLRGRRGVGSKP